MLRPARPRVRRTAALLTLLVGALLAAGCSGSDGDQGSGPSASSTAASPTDDAVGTLVQTGLDQLAAGDSTSAEGTFENVLSLDPANLYAHYNLGLIAQQANDPATAIEHYDAALAAQADYAPALYNKGILTEPTDLGAAVDLYRQAITSDDTFARAYMRLGFALVHLGDTKEGEKALGKGVQLDPSMADVQAPSYG